MYVYHMECLVRAVLEFMPGVGRDDRDPVTSYPLRFAVNNGFDFSIEYDEGFFVGMAMFVRSLPRTKLNDEERNIGSVLEAMQRCNLSIR
jgi:hypothetical protein